MARWALEVLPRPPQACVKSCSVLNEFLHLLDSFFSGCTFINSENGLTGPLGHLSFIWVPVEFWSCSETFPGQIDYPSLPEAIPVRGGVGLSGFLPQVQRVRRAGEEVGVLREGGQHPGCCLQGTCCPSAPMDPRGGG